MCDKVIITDFSSRAARAVVGNDREVMGMNFVPRLHVSLDQGGESENFQVAIAYRIENFSLNNGEIAPRHIYLSGQEEDQK